MVFRDEAMRDGCLKKGYSCGEETSGRDAVLKIDPVIPWINAVNGKNGKSWVRRYFS